MYRSNIPRKTHNTEEVTSLPLSPSTFSATKKFRYPFKAVSKNVAYSSELSLLFVGGLVNNFNQIGVYSSKTLKQIKMLPTAQKTAFTVFQTAAYRNTYYLFVGSLDGSVKVWDIKNNFRLVDSLKFKNSVYAIEVVQAKEAVVIAGYFTDFYCWDLKAKSITKVIQTGEIYYFTCVKYVHKGDYLATVCIRTGEMMLFDWEFGGMLFRKQEFVKKQQVFAIDVSVSETVMVTGSNSGTIVLWDIGSKQIAPIYQITSEEAIGEYNSFIKCIYFLDNEGQQFVGAYTDSMLTFWNAGSVSPVGQTLAFEMGSSFLYDKKKSLFFCFDYNLNGGYAVGRRGPFPKTSIKHKNT